MWFTSNTSFEKSCHLQNNYRKHARTRDAKEIADNLHITLCHVDAIHMPGN